MVCVTEALNATVLSAFYTLAHTQKTQHMRHSHRDGMPFAHPLLCFFFLPVLSSFPLIFTRKKREATAPTNTKLPCSILQILDNLCEMGTHVIQTEILALCFWIDCC